ncbi:4264_t:CDS:2 [Paraglomus occultum]|uniref:4264_t:CDS:1 n=1 Tax=Paraglomus occultum TaxID=144539 RepID=A0A9N9A824_9GLOM|nr:4264_t:CDS:2 [Paraglomus occultum]
MDLDWCLTCSQHTSGGLYCSDSCRLKDIDASTPIIPFSGSPRLIHYASTRTTATTDPSFASPSSNATTITTEPYLRYNTSMPSLVFPKPTQQPSQPMSYGYNSTHLLPPAIHRGHNSDCREYQYTVQRLPRMPVVI